MSLQNNVGLISKGSKDMVNKISKTALVNYLLSNWLNTCMYNLNQKRLVTV